MATLMPFRAWRPDPSVVADIACVPYDVITTEAARQEVQRNPHSFLRVVRPEVSLPESVDLYHHTVYETGKDQLDDLLASGQFMQDPSPSLYVYRLRLGEIEQTGVVGGVSVHDYDHDVILKHELTRPDKENDRTRHILTQQAHAESVMMTVKDDEQLMTLIRQATTEDPIYDFEAADGVQHTVWQVHETETWVMAFRDIEHMYIADGHHRCASASRAAHEMQSQHPTHGGNEPYHFFPAVIFPSREMTILSYNRVVKSVPNGFFKELESKFELKTSTSSVPEQKGQVALYFNNTWNHLTLPAAGKDDAASQLDVARLQEHLLEPLLGISDQRTDNNIDFVGGIQSTGTLERMVDDREADLGISLFPTSVDELIQVSDEGLLMPPKSTWFEPKLRSGLLIHTF